MSNGVQPGSYAAVPTPLTPAGDVDESALAHVLEHILTGGCRGVLVLGSSGEVAALSPESRRNGPPHGT